MLVRVKKIVSIGVMTLATAVISLPVASFAATSPSVSVLAPLVNGLKTPVKIALDADGNVYVADPRAGGVVKYNAYGEQQLIVQTTASPSGLAFAQDGTLLVSQGASVVRYDAVSGQQVGLFTGLQLQNPVGIAVDNVTGYVFVADSKANQVVVYTASGEYVTAFAKGSVADAGGATVLNPAGKLTMPTGVAFEKVSRQLAVADTLGRRVQFFDVDNNYAYVKSIGNVIPGGTTSIFSGTIAPMQFSSPVAIAFEYSKGQSQVLNRMYVVDSYQGNIQVVDSAVPAAIPVTGSTGNFIGSAGVANGQLMVPSDVAFDATNNRLMVVNGFGNVTNFGIDGGKNPVAVVVVPPVDPTPVVVTATAVTVAQLPLVTNSAIAKISGTVDAGATVTVVNQATSKSGDALVAGGTWSYDVALTEGVNSLSISAQKTGSSKSVVVASISLDTTPPSLNVSAIPSGSTTSTQVQNVSGTVVDQSGATVTVNGAAVAVNGNTFSTAVTLLSGSNQVSVVAVDAVGNAKSDVRTIVFDPAKPVIAIVAPVDNSFTSNAIVTVTGSVENSSEITVAGVPATVNGGNWSANVTLAAGVNTINVVAKGLGGKESTDKRTVTLDAAKPVLAIVTPAQDIAVNVPNVQISGTVSDSTAVTVEYVLNGVTAPAAISGNTYTFNVDFAAEGSFPITITAKDLAGNVTTAVRNVIYDKTPPKFTLNQVNGAAPEKLSGTVEDGSSVVIKDGTKQIALATSANGLWSADLTGISYNSDTLLAVATDAAGNSTSSSLSYSFPDGTLNGTGTPTIQDALRAIRIAVNQSTPTAQELAHYDIGPLVGGKPNPNGKIEIVDAILILRKALGRASW